MLADEMNRNATPRTAHPHQGPSRSALTLLAAFAPPASAHAWDSPLAPVTPTVDATQPHGLGLVPDGGPSPLSVQGVGSALPPAVDMTADAVPPGDQGQVNACAAWATDYSAMGYYMNKQGIAGGALAPMYTYAQVAGGQNVGTTLVSHMQVAKTQGVDAQSDYAQGNYNYTQQPSVPQKANAANWRSTGSTALAVNPSSSSTVTQDSPQAALADGTPVVVAIPVYQNFYNVTSANDGLYDTVAGPLQGYHAVTALGYDAGGLRVENQWGTHWGDGGWATLSWGFVNRYVIEARAVLPMVQPAALPTPTAAPVASGTVKRGSTLSVTNGAWTENPLSYTYQWQRDKGTGFTNIAGATPGVLHARRERPQRLHPRPGQRAQHQWRERQSRDVQHARPGHRRPARQHRAPAGHRHGRPRQHARRDRRDLGRRGEHLQLPVAALRQLDLDDDRQRDDGGLHGPAG